MQPIHKGSLDAILLPNCYKVIVMAWTRINIIMVSYLHTLVCVVFADLTCHSYQHNILVMPYSPHKPACSIVPLPNYPQRLHASNYI